MSNEMYQRQVYFFTILFLWSVDRDESKVSTCNMIRACNKRQAGAMILMIILLNPEYEICV